MHHEAFLGLSDIALAMLALSVCGALGLALGGLAIRGVGLGIGGVLFAGLFVGDLAGRAGIEFDRATLEFVREFGLIVFVYTIGVQVGPGFFASFRESGLRLNAIAAGIVLLGVATTVAVHFVFGLDVPALVGVMSGAVTNTPGLGAAVQTLTDAGMSAEELARPSIGYAVAYPFGIVGILLAMLLLRFALRIDVERENRAWEASRAGAGGALPTLDVVVANPNFDGVPLSEVPGLSDEDVICSRLQRGGRLTTPGPATVLAMGDALHLVGPAKKLAQMRLILGREADAPLTTHAEGAEIAWERAVVTESAVLGRRIGSLGLMERHGVRISRVNRAGAELLARGALTLQFGDMVTLVGPKANLAPARALLGDKRARLEQVDFRAMFLGLGLGVLLGSIPIFVPGLPAPLRLGLAGGPLVAAILLARLGHLGSLVWFMPPAANHALREFGIVLFLAVVGLKSGDKFLDALLVGDGVLWMACGALVTLVPLLTMAFVARLAAKANYLEICGVLAGASTDPPALAFANALAPSQAAAIAYASVYPLVMFLRILAPQLLALLLLAA